MRRRDDDPDARDDAGDWEAEGGWGDHGFPHAWDPEEMEAYVAEARERHQERARRRAQLAAIKRGLPIVREFLRDLGRWFRERRQHRIRRAGGRVGGGQGALGPAPAALPRAGKRKPRPAPPPEPKPSQQQRSKGAKESKATPRKTKPPGRTR
jgi:hypothetical protein